MAPRACDLKWGPRVLRSWSPGKLGLRRFFKLQKVHAASRHPALLFCPMSRKMPSSPGMSRQPFRPHTAPFKHPANPRAPLKGTSQNLKGAGVTSAAALRLGRVSQDMPVKVQHKQLCRQHFCTTGQLHVLVSKQTKQPARRPDCTAIKGLARGQQTSNKASTRTPTCYWVCWHLC